MVAADQVIPIPAVLSPADAAALLTGATALAISHTDVAALTAGQHRERGSASRVQGAGVGTPPSCNRLGICVAQLYLSVREAGAG